MRRIAGYQTTLARVDLCALHIDGEHQTIIGSAASKPKPLRMLTMPKTIRFGRKTALLLLACIAAWPTPLLADATAARSDFAIVGINVIPMDEERLLENQVVVVADGVIQSVSDTASTTLPSDMRQISGDGRYLMPGLADLHIHLRHEDELIGNLSWGVTTVMHLGGSQEMGMQLVKYRDQVQRGTRLGPNIYTTGRILDGDPAIASGAYSLATVQQARQAVADLKSDGFDFVKIYNNVSLPIFEAIVDEAETQGLSVFGHIPRNFDTLSALGAGQDVVVHTEEFFFAYFDGPGSTSDMTRNYKPDLSKLPALIETLIDNDVAVMPDLSFTFTNMLMWDGLEHLWGDPEFAYLHPDTASMWEVSNINRRDNLDNFMVRGQWKFNLMQKLTLEFQKAGVLQVVGTDASLPGLFPGKAVHRELTELVKAGVSNYEALAMGTRNAGEFIRRYIKNDTLTGQISPGYRADLVVLDANPLQDIRNAREVNAVIVNGVYTSTSQLDDHREIQQTRYARLTAVNKLVDAALQSEHAEREIHDLVLKHENDTEILNTIESRINAAGYAAAYAGELDRSQQTFELNTRFFPQSANTWDSLAEVVLYRGEPRLALQLYRKVLEIDPTSSSAAENISRILENAD